MIERPLTTVGGLIIADDGDLLLVRSKKWHDLYTVPGGKVELGESLEQALNREIWEETHLRVINVRFALIQEAVFSPEFWQKRHFVMNDYVVDLDPRCHKEQVILNDEAYAFVWVKPVEALSMPLQKECRILIQWYIDHDLKTAIPTRLETPAHLAGLKTEMGYIGFHQHKIECIVGIYPEERQQKQLLYVDLKVKANLFPCLKDGLIENTIDYAQLAAACSRLAQEKKYALIESFASDVLDFSLGQFKASWAWVRIQKPAGVPTAAYAFVEMERVACVS